MAEAAEPVVVVRSVDRVVAPGPKTTSTEPSRSVRRTRARWASSRPIVAALG